MQNTSTAPAGRALTFIGEEITHTVGRYTITLQWVREGAYTVTVYQGTLRIEDLSVAWPEENAARAYARGLVVMYKAEQPTELAHEELELTPPAPRGPAEHEVTTDADLADLATLAGLDTLAGRPMLDPDEDGPWEAMQDHGAWPTWL